MLEPTDDIDEFYRTAAENYPLKTNSNDWNKVHGELLDSKNAFFAEHRGQWNKKWLLLLLLLPVLWVGNHYFTISYRRADTQSSDKLQANNTKAIIDPLLQSKNKNERILAVKSLQYAHVLKQTSSLPKLEKSRIKQSLHKNARQHIIINESIPTMRDTFEKELEQYHSSSKYDVSDKTGNNELYGPLYEEDYKSSKVKTDIPETHDSLPTPLQEASKKKKKLQSSVKGLYAGILLGVDWSSVNAQSIKHSGMQGGILIGYKASQRLSLESGIYWDRKYYFTDGKYFNTDKIYQPPSSKLLVVNGYCQMIEIPLDVKYNFRTKSKSEWFSLAGLSSYFMSKQGYDYTFVHNNYSYDKHYEYNTKSTNIFTVINFSAGYSRFISPNISVRFQPYIKIPISEIGTGKLPVSSAGFNIGFTHKF